MFRISLKGNPILKAHSALRSCWRKANTWHWRYRRNSGVKITAKPCLVKRLPKQALEPFHETGKAGVPREPCASSVSRAQLSDKAHRRTETSSGFIPRAPLQPRKTILPGRTRCSKRLAGPAALPRGTDNSSPAVARAAAQHSEAAGTRSLAGPRRLQKGSLRSQQSDSQARGTRGEVTSRATFGSAPLDLSTDASGRT